MRLIDDAERRARLARRHAIAAQHRVSAPVAATRAMTALHATEAYVQDEDGRVDVVPQQDPGKRGRAALAEQAGRLTEWFDGEVVVNVYKSELVKSVRLR